MTTPDDLQKSMPNQKKQLWLFTGLQVIVSALWMLIAGKRRKLLPLNIYQNCHETPMSVFISCLVDNDLAGLVKHGSARARQITAAWEKIYYEYLDLSDNISMREMFQLLKETTLLENQVILLNICATVQTKNCIDILSKMGYKDIGKVGRSVKMIELNIERNKKRINELIGTDKKSKVSREYFYELFAITSKYMGFRVTPESVTVTEFINYQKLMEKWHQKEQ